jgi:hypothetical protein
MDPNVALETILRLAKESETASGSELQLIALHISESVISLDEWIRKGGFLPSEWQKGGK